MTNSRQQKQLLDNIYLGIIGSPDFCRRLSAAAKNCRKEIKICSASILDAWSLVLTHKPNLLIIELGFLHSERMHSVLRKFLHQLRDRFEHEIYITLAITACEKLFFAGDLLFLKENSLEPSAYVDTFMALPPSDVPSVPGLTEQLDSVLSLVSAEFHRRAEGGVPIPPLGTFGWIQSLADPISRELWMKWLPRYASYTNENPIIIGQTGTGKTNLAYALHLLSGLKGEFISITPRDFSSSELIQVELFGAIAGAYTGAVDKWGVVKAAENGTLFIDELQSIDKDLQGKLITFIENKVYRRVGSAETTEANVRFVFASNRTLYDMTESNTLRDDFAYRLERVHLELRPLEARRLDITAALSFALAKIQRQRPFKHQVQGLSPSAYRMLFGHSWPGNLRQLENSVAKLCELADMEGLPLIDEYTVNSVFEAKISGRLDTTTEVFALAARKLATSTWKDSFRSLQEGTAKYSELVRMAALEISGGDIEKAAQLVSDNPKLMELVSVASSTREEMKLQIP